MIIPLGTDAPIYHWPYATVGLILVNVAVMFAVPPVHNDPDPDDPGAPVAVSPFDLYALTLGNGLHPVQWVTHNFLHYGFMHLAGNMLFLWSFGIVAEGKLGAVKFLALFLLIGTLHGALTQTLLLRSGLAGNAAGASAVVFGLLAVCMVWAPRNELNCIAVFLIGFRVLVFHWDLRYTTVALIYIGEEIFWLVLHGALRRDVISEMGHLSGAFWGALMAVALVQTKLVDCEGWDLFTLANKRKQLAKDWKKRVERLDRVQKSTKEAVASRSRGDDEPDPEQRAAAALRKVRKVLDQGDSAGAVAAFDKSARTLVRWPSEAELYDLIKTFHAQKADVDSIPLMRTFCRNYPDAPATPRMRLKLAQVLIRDRQRPGNALRVLGEMPPGPLEPSLEEVRQKLVKVATRMQEDGVLELEGDD